jgi:hypothetical protein
MTSMQRDAKQNVEDTTSRHHHHQSQKLPAASPVPKPCHSIRYILFCLAFSLFFACTVNIFRESFVHLYLLGTNVNNGIR